MKFKKFLVYFVLTVTYFNIGSLYVETLEKEFYSFLKKGEKSYLFPVISPVSEKKTRELYLSYNKYISLQEFLEEEKHWYYYLGITIWPVVFVSVTGWQWILIAFRFLLFGGLLSFVIKNYMIILILFVLWGLWDGIIKNN